MFSRLYFAALVLLFFAMRSISAQEVAQQDLLLGTVYGLEFVNSKQDTIPLYAVNIFWQDTVIGATTNEKGQFHINRPTDGKNMLIVSYVGFENDTLVVDENTTAISIFMKDLKSTEEVQITANKPHELRDTQTALNSEMITTAGLQTMACCTLAESFENTAAVDVEQADAVSGAKRIKMLGLAGFYTQMMIEKKPVMRGLVSPFAMEYLPGPWIEAINISKGTASVATGYESITGQINVELKKPETSDAPMLNLFQNSMGRSELVFTGAKKLNDNVSTMMLGYASFNQKKWDTNNDTFLDMPLVSHFNLMNRWKFKSGNKAGQIGFKVIRDNRKGGQQNAKFNQPTSSFLPYASKNETARYEAYAKAGFSFDDQGSSVGLVVSAFQHDQESFWGLKNYSGKESSFYSNLAVNKIVNRHTFAAGASYTFNDRNEKYVSDQFIAREHIPGVFAEYTYQVADLLTAMAGYRYDNHNLYGVFSTPRVHLKYQPSPKSSIRLSAGKGYRTPYIFMDNPAILASSRELSILETIKAEEAWNAGLQFVQDFQFGTERPASLIIDFYRTDFQNQVVVDMEQSSRQILLYNLNGKSYSNSAQVELETTVARGLTSTLAFRFNDVKTTYMNELLDSPLNNKYKGLLVLSYTPMNSKWQFDFTSQFNGKSRLPQLLDNPAEYKIDCYSPSYVLLFAQVQRTFNNFEIYAGIENITDYRQPNPILAWQDPFGPYFDSSLIWGPTVGRRMYAGIRINS